MAFGEDPVQEPALIGALTVNPFAVIRHKKLRADAGAETSGECSRRQRLPEQNAQHQQRIRLPIADIQPDMESAENKLVKSITS